jgi:hypothetical protein
LGTARTILGKMGTLGINLVRSICLVRTLRRTDQELARRNAARPSKDFRWFTPEEALAAEALARIIVPSDGETPGLEDVGVLDAPAVTALDNIVFGSPYRHHLYSRGLLAFDNWALAEHGCKFAEVPAADQVKFFAAAQQLSENKTGGASRFLRVWRKLRVTPATSALHGATLLFPHIINDCIQVFYTSRVSWVWLEYDGPPMDKGYVSVTAPR